MNQSEIDNEKVRSEFLDFHYYLGGLLFYKNRIECIRRIWNHTNSESPSYPLLPVAMGEIFKRYFDLCQIFDNILWEKAARFNFPRVDSINFDWVVNSWIRKYIILLFLRQYTLQRYHTFDNFLELPISPESQAVKKHWINNIQRFIDDLKEVLNDMKILKALQLDKITKESCMAENKIYPIELVETFKRQLNKDFEQAKFSQPVSQKKEKMFFESCKDQLEKAIEEYKNVVTSNASTVGENWRDPFYLNGGWLTADKSIYAEDQPSDHLNYDSFLAEEVANNMRCGISETFLIVATQGYLLKEDDLFKSIDKLKITEKPNDFVIISFKNNFDYYTSVLKVPGLNKSDYKGIAIIDIWNCSGHIVGNTFFILQKTDLPHLEFKKPDSKWGIIWKKEEMIILDKNVFAAIIDLHKYPDVIQKLNEERKKENLEDKVLVTIEMLGQVLWKKDAKVVALQVASVYEERGIPNKLEEVKPFDEI